jgi:hypothetical protein
LFVAHTLLGRRNKGHAIGCDRERRNIVLDGRIERITPLLAQRRRKEDNIEIVLR